MSPTSMEKSWSKPGGAAAARTRRGQQPPMPPQALTVSLAWNEDPEPPKPNVRLLTKPQLDVSSTLVQLPRSNLYWNWAPAAAEIVSVQVLGPVFIIGISAAPQSCDDFIPVPSTL